MTLQKCSQDSVRGSLNKAIFLKDCNIQGCQTHYLYTGPQGSNVNRASTVGQNMEAAWAVLAWSQLFDLLSVKRC